jgi:hypothetical protein
VTDADVPDADVVLATHWTTAAGVAALSPDKGAKAILLQGYETSPGGEDPAIDAARRLPLHKIVISRWLVDWSKARFGDTDVHHVPNSVDTAQFHAAPRGRQAHPTVGMLYATFHAKGTDVALRALERVREQVPDLKVLAFGAERVAPDLPLPPWIEFHYRPPQDHPLLPVRRVAMRQSPRGLSPAAARGHGVPLPGRLDARRRPDGRRRGRGQRLSRRRGRRGRALRAVARNISTRRNTMETDVRRGARHRDGLHLGRRDHAA